MSAENLYERFGPMAPEIQRLVDLEPSVNPLSIQAIGNLQPGSRLLELGAGPGTELVQHYARQGVECWVLDYRDDVLALHRAAEDQRVAEARAQEGHEDEPRRVFTIQGDIKRDLVEQLEQRSRVYGPGLAVGIGDFDVVHARALLAYGTNHVRAACLSEIHDLLDKNGKFVGVDNVWSSALAHESDPMRGIARLALQVQGFHGDYGRVAMHETQLAWRDKGDASYTALRLDFAPGPQGYKQVLPLETAIVMGSRAESTEISDRAARYFAQMQLDALLAEPPALAHPSLVATIATKRG
jgi:SAM-dependent methyltransferase